MPTYISERITIDPTVCNGKPCVRGLRITAQTILEFIKAGDSPTEIIAQYPLLELDDIFPWLVSRPNTQAKATHRM